MSPFPDVTRAIILDESQGAVVGEMVAGLLKDINPVHSFIVIECPL